MAFAILGGNPGREVAVNCSGECSDDFQRSNFSSDRAPDPLYTYENRGAVLQCTK